MPEIRWTMIRDLDDVRALKPAQIFWGANTCWWTASPADVMKHPESGLPCDPRGGMLFETADVAGWIASAEASPDHYGSLGHRTLMAAYHGNAVISAEDVAAHPDRQHMVGVPSAWESWLTYADALVRAGHRAPQPDGTTYYLVQQAGLATIDRARQGNGAARRLDPTELRKFREHRPDGLEAEVALAILYDFTGDPDRSIRLHQTFKLEMLAGWSKPSLDLTGGEIRSWLERQKR